MNKVFGFLIAVSFFYQQTPAQTLFTYAGHAVDAKEFLKSYHKMNAGEKAVNKEKSIREYLKLYIQSRLKIREAYERHYDTAAAFQEEINTLRHQLMANYMMDADTYQQLAREAWARSQRDILVQHIFIPYQTKNQVSDSAIARLKIREAFLELTTGKKFEEVALKYSADPEVSNNKGTIGFITVFSLPYSFENIVYNLMPGQYSEPYKSPFGYHIFKNVKERKSVGSIRIAQILLALPPGSTPDEKKKNEQLADSLYQRLLKGDDFAKLASQFSNDYISAASGGQLPEFFPGTYDPVFENAVFSLPVNGSISKPFLTTYGYHIVKRVSFSPPSATPSKEALDLIKIRLDKDDRVELAKEALINRIKNQAGFRMAELPMSLLKNFIDSALKNKPAPAGNSLNKEFVLLKIGDQEKTVGDLVAYAETNSWQDDETGNFSFEHRLDEFIRSSILDFYKNHLEEYNEEFREQMKELTEGNLFFDIMMKEVWNKAQTDSAGQAAFYNQNRKNYRWNKSADAVIFYCGNEETAYTLRKLLIKQPAEWKSKTEEFMDRVTTDSGRFEWNRIPGLQKNTPIRGMWTNVETNPQDKSAAFAWVIKVYIQPAQKSFIEARGDVIADYQNELDRQWTEVLKKKYPVQVNENVVQSLIK